jgi:hypothetical protein
MDDLHRVKALNEIEIKKHLFENETLE